MDGTYNNPFAQGQSPLTPDTPTAGSYQVNINRKKTRKWVEAKVQNYDGDDWGADESEDDEPVPPPPVSRVTTGLRSIGQRLPSEQNRPSPRLAAAVASSSRSSSGPPSLHLQTEHSAAEAEHAAPLIPTIPAHVQGAARNPSSPIGGRNASPAPLPSQVSSVAGFQAEARSSTPHSTASSTPAKSSSLIRPSDIYRHVEDDRKTAGSPQPATDFTAPKPAERFTPPSEEASQQITNAPAPFAAVEKKEPVVDAYPPIDRNRSVSPKLPDVTRMSVFGSDFFSTSNNETQDPVKQDQLKVLEPLITEASSGKGAAEQPESTVGSQSQQGERPPVSGRSVDNSEPPVDAKSQPPILSLQDPRSIPPLRTPSPHAKGSAPPTEPHNAVPTSQVYSTPTQALGPEITPTEPLQPRRLDSSVSEFQPQPLLRESTLSTVTSSPIKDSDMLSDEIMRTLSPAGTAPTPTPLGETSTSLAPVDRRDTRNSSYTLSDYDSYWEDSTEKSGPEKKGGEPVTSPASAPSSAQGSQALVRPTDTPSSTVSALAPSSGDNETGSQEHPDLRKRFSWEAGFEPNAKVLKGETPADGSSTAVPRINTPSSLGQSDIQSPKDVVSDVTSPVVDTPKMSRTPGEISQQPSMLSIGPQTHLLPSMLEPPSPVSTRTDESIVPGSENRRQSVGNEKMLIDTPSHAVAMTPPPDDRPTTSTAPPPLPGHLPDVMGFKEIMGLPNPDQRIAKYEESQRAFATAETGLDNWILSLKNQHPEYANATSSFSGTSAQIVVPGGSIAGSVGSNPPTQQPYYQQYLNASSPSVNAPITSGRSRIGGLPIPSQAASTFGNSSNQIGTKGKELMHSAGKMGKGLFSKGRSKLRGTGDKVFH
ncbi:hypothetical protein QQZ08_000716 [Neonectria magnoliae]|uniref:Uncharacterized protein n=1 Tax=Neonectria magnoliae TaxID=2732573 RepID=A0ABR1IGS2_9HYPO